MTRLERLQAASPLIFFTVLGWALHRCRGHYDGKALWAVIAAFLGAQLGFRSRPDILARQTFARGASLLSGLSIVVLAYFLARIIYNPLVIYADVPEAKALTMLSIKIALGLTFVLAWATFDRRIRIRARWPALAIAASLIAAKYFAIKSSPHPFIDVFTVPTQATDYFLAGLNPYTQPYVDIYHGAYHYPAAFDYWPGLLYIESFFRFITGDVRFASMASDLGTAFCVYRILRKLRLQELSHSLPLLWLAFPCSLFVLEQAWIDPILLSFGALFTLFALDKRWLRAGLALGLFCTIKQYAIFFAILALFLSLREEKPKRACLRMIGGALASFSVVMLPMILWNPSAFYERTILLLLAQEMRTDALTLSAWLYYLHLPTITVTVSMPICLAVLAFGCRAILRARVNPLYVFFCSVTLTYGVVFLLGKQAFCNYYYLLAGFVLLQLAVGSGSRNAER